MVHDHQFDRLIADYAGRQKVKPGITGWAQVHGLRGETDTLDKMTSLVKELQDSIAALELKMQEESGENLIEEARHCCDVVIPANVPPDVAQISVTGTVAAGIDFSDYLAARTLLFFAAARSLYGGFGSAAPPAVQAYVAARTARSERTQA